MSIAQDTVKELNLGSLGELTDSVLNSPTPIVLRGLCANWPAVIAAKISHKEAADYLLEFDQEIPLVAYEGEADINGRIFYNDDFTGFNFNRTRQPLRQIIDKLFAACNQSPAPTYYVGSTMIEHWLPGFRNDNDLDLGARVCG